METIVTFFSFEQIEQQRRISCKWNQNIRFAKKIMSSWCRCSFYCFIVANKYVHYGEFFIHLFCFRVPYLVSDALRYLRFWFRPMLWTLFKYMVNFWQTRIVYRRLIIIDDNVSIYAKFKCDLACWCGTKGKSDKNIRIIPMQFPDRMNSLFCNLFSSMIFCPTELHDIYCYYLSLISINYYFYCYQQQSSFRWNIFSIEFELESQKLIQLLF